MKETIYSRAGAPDRGIRLRQRTHVVALPPGTTAWTAGDSVGGPFTAAATATVVTEQSWSEDTALVRVPEGPMGKRRRPFETTAVGRHFVPRDPHILMEEAPMWVLILFPDGPEWVSEESVFFDKGAAEACLDVSRRSSLETTL
jgi:hypothetical protein